MTIGVFFGSRSAEHDVSIITAQLIISGLKKLNHEVVPVYITKEGGWRLGENLDSLKQFSEGKTESLGSENYVLDLENSQGKMTFKKKGLLGKEVIIDLAFPAFHGTYGEDGSIQGVFEMLNVPYVGCDVSSSAIAMDKVLTKLFFQGLNIPTTKFFWSHKNDWDKSRKEFLDKIKTLTLPVFVKPAHLGSSIGMTKVKTWEELEPALEVAFHYDNKVLVEEGVENVVDLTCALLEDGERVIPSQIQESSFSGDMFDYETKYLEGSGKTVQSGPGIVIPARIENQHKDWIQKTSVEVFTKLGMSGTGRVDFLMNSTTKEIFVNEINPLPGTLYSHLWEKSGVEFGTLLSKLIDSSKKRYTEKSELTVSFDSPILSQLKGAKMGSKLTKE